MRGKDHRVLLHFEECLGGRGGGQERLTHLLKAAVGSPPKIQAPSPGLSSHVAESVDVHWDTAEPCPWFSLTRCTFKGWIEEVGMK